MIRKRCTLPMGYEGLTLGPGATYINATKTFTKIVMVLRESSVDPPLFRIETAYPN